jgi:hypothetical protein
MAFHYSKIKKIKVFLYHPRLTTCKLKVEIAEPPVNSKEK